MRTVNDVLLNLNVALCSQIDTITLTTVTLHLHLLHDYQEVTSSFISPIHLVAPLDSNFKVSPIGQGFLHVPSEDVSGCLGLCRIKCFYSPSLITTLIDESSLYGAIEQSK